MDKEELEKIRMVSLHEVLGLTKGKRVKLKCPFHQEKSASFYVFPNNTYKCFGCGVQGNNSIDYLIQSGLTFPDTLKELKEFIK